MTSGFYIKSNRKRVFVKIRLVKIISIFQINREPFTNFHPAAITQCKLVIVFYFRIVQVFVYV